MLKGILVIFLIVLLFIFPFLRFLPFNLHNIVYYLPVDVYRYIKYKKYNECKNYGYIKIMCGYFGSGKSLSASAEVINIYNRYNGKIVWDKDLEAFVTQKITIYSNIALSGVPYYEFTSEQQFIDVEASPGEVLIFLVDEIGTVWNNRNFKNFNPDVFQNIVQSRKRKMAIYGTLPVLAGTDINIRRYTDNVVFCDKTWRIIKHRYFKAVDLENCGNVDMLEPILTEYKFVTDKMYNQYNSFQMVDKLTKDMKEGKLMTFAELDKQDAAGDIKQVKLKKKFRKRQV